MTRRPMIRPLLLLALLASTAAAQAPANPAGGPYKVAFWYEASRPTTSLQYQAYDLGKGEYDPKAVDLWFRTVLANHPDHGAYVREVRTEGLPGATEPERLALAIDREKQRWADLHRRPSRPVPGLAETSTTRRRPIYIESPARTSFDRPAPGSPGVPPGSPTSPFPYPYRSGPR